MPLTDTDFEAKVSMETEANPVPEDPPLHILFAGDFSGRENLRKAGVQLPAFAKPIEIDRDSFENVMRGLNTGLRIEPGGPGTGMINLSFRSLDDFHPDAIFNKVSLFSDLREIRKRLLDPSEFDSAAREVRGWLNDDGEETEEAAPAPEVLSDAGSEDLLDDILGSTKRDAASYASQSTEKTPLTRLVRELVRSHLITTDEAEQEKLVAAVDAMTGDLMVRIVHHPDFRALETAWRGMYLVTRGVETGKDLRLYLADISKKELIEDLKSVSDLTESAYFGLATREGESGVDDAQWGMICGNFSFALNVEDAAALIRLGKVSHVVRAPFMSHIRPEMLGVSSLAEAPVPEKWNLKDETEEGKLWTMLRTVPEAVSVGLALPRFLARLPYGEDTDPTEAFNFEELGDERSHDDYLWANPSFICGLLLAQSFVGSGWEIGGRYVLDVHGLPTHVFQQDGETVTKPCAEIAMTHEACDTLIEQGLMPLISFKDTDRVRLGGFHSIAFPLKALAGRWS